MPLDLDDKELHMLKFTIVEIEAMDLNFWSDVGNQQDLA